MKGHDEFTMDDTAKLMWLLDQGFKCGVRDSRINTNYPGAYMVAEAHEESELPTKDGSNGPWCIVGDDYPKLISEAYSVWYGTWGDDGTSGQDRESYSDTQDRDSYTVED